MRSRVLQRSVDNSDRIILGNKINKPGGSFSLQLVRLGKSESVGKLGKRSAARGQLAELSILRRFFAAALRGSPVNSIPLFLRADTGCSARHPAM